MHELPLPQKVSSTSFILMTRREKERGKEERQREREEMKRGGKNEGNREGVQLGKENNTGFWE